MAALSIEILISALLAKFILQQMLLLRRVTASSSMLFRKEDRKQSVSYWAFAERLRSGAQILAGIGEFYRRKKTAP
jgi:hypothetical protein